MCCWTIRLARAWTCVWCVLKYLFVYCYVGFLCIGISGKFIGGLKGKFVINVNGFCYGLDWMKNLVEVVLSAWIFVLALEVLPFSYLLNSSLHLDWKWQEEKGREGGGWRRKKRNWSLYETLLGSILGKKSLNIVICIYLLKNGFWFLRKSSLFWISSSSSFLPWSHALTFLFCIRNGI